MNSHHRAETNRFLYLARLQLEMAANSDLRDSLSVPDAIHEAMFFQTTLHFLHRAYQHYLLEIAETTQCKLVADRAVPMLEQWNSEGWYSDQLTELEKLESTESWLADFLAFVDVAKPVLQSDTQIVSHSDFLIAVANPDEKTPIENLQHWLEELQNLIQRQRQFNQNW